MNEKQLLTQIQAVSLIAIDLHLFLDTHPNDTKALQDYEKVSKQFQTLKDQYEKQYGPHVSFGHQSITNHNEWVSKPWPWQNK